MELFDLYTAAREKTDRKMILGEPTLKGFIVLLCTSVFLILKAEC